MNFGERVFEALMRQKANGPLSPELARGIIQTMFDAEVPAASRAVSPKASDGDFVAELEVMPCYAGIDVRRELGKAIAWGTANKSTITRRRFVNWLNKIERPLSPVNGQPIPKLQPTIQEPLNWREWAKESLPGCIWLNSLWSSMPLHAQKAIAEGMGLMPLQGAKYK